jgi:hypothetical protein
MEKKDGLMDLQCLVNLFDGFVHVAGHAVAVFVFKLAASFFQQTARFGHLLVRFPLALAFGDFAAEVKAQGMTGDFNFSDGLDAVTVVITVGVFEKMVGVNHFFARGFGVGGKPDGQGCHNRRDLETQFA